jgi:chemotaxis protein methyltransferase CheR
VSAPAGRAGPGELDRFRELVREASGLELPQARRSWPTSPSGRPNRPQFEALERHILPEIIDRRRHSRRLRLWSAACSTGEEPYSLAILVDRLLPDRSGWDVRILATDINRAALERARSGRYGAWSFREVPADVAAFFVRRDRGVEVAAHIREAVSFAYLNLADDRWPSVVTQTVELDLILCRNVLLYFGDELTRRIAAKLHDALAEGGWLLVAPAELSQDVFRRFAVSNLGGAVAYRKPAAPAPAPAPAPVPAPARAPAPAAVGPVVHSSPAGPDEMERAVAAWRAGRTEEALGLLEALAEADPADGRAPLLAARVHLDRLELDQAERWADVACQRTPLSAPAHHLRGLALQEAGRLDDALAALRRSVFLDPGSVLAQVALADLLERQGEPARARSALRAAAALLGDGDPGDPVPGHDELAIGRVRELVAARLARLDAGQGAAR